MNWIQTLPSIPRIQQNHPQNPTNIFFSVTILRNSATICHKRALFLSHSLGLQLSDMIQDDFLLTKYLLSLYLSLVCFWVGGCWLHRVAGISTFVPRALKNSIVNVNISVYDTIHRNCAALHLRGGSCCIYCELHMFGCYVCEWVAFVKSNALMGGKGVVVEILRRLSHRESV